MKVTRDFFTDKATGADTYEWRVEFEGRQYVTQQRVPDAGVAIGRMVPLVELERQAQREIMRAIKDCLFGERAL